MSCVAGVVVAALQSVRSRASAVLPRVEPRKLRCTDLGLSVVGRASLGDSARPTGRAPRLGARRTASVPTAARTRSRPAGRPCGRQMLAISSTLPSRSRTEPSKSVVLSRAVLHRPCRAPPPCPCRSTTRPLPHS
jgi:hypothetical protein